MRANGWGPPVGGAAGVRQTSREAYLARRPGAPVASRRTVGANGNANGYGLLRSG